VLLACLAGACHCFAEDQPAPTFFVAPGGNDGWAGRLPTANAEKNDGPFATLAKARDAVRQVKQQGELKKPITVMVRGGKHFLKETLVLSAEDSGSRQYPITYTAYPGEKPILSGGRIVTGWKPYKGKILQCELSGAKGGKWKSRQLFLDGKRQIRARTPNFDPKNPLYGGWAISDGPDKPLSTTGFRFKPGTFSRRWAKPTEAEVNFITYAGWGNNIIPIKTFDQDTRTIVLAHGARDFDREPWFFRLAAAPAGTRFIVENVLEELDQPGEWCLDSEEGRLYFWPPTDSIQSAEVVVPWLDCLVALRDVSHVTISGLTFTETIGGDNLHRPGCEGLGAMFHMEGWKYCGEAMHLSRATYCRIEDNHFQAVGGNAIYLDGYNARNLIRRNEISQAGANGVCLAGAMGRGSAYGADGQYHALSLAGTTTQYPVFNEVVDNHIHHCGAINMFTAGVFAGLSEGNVIGHNSIHDMPHHAINLAGTGLSRNIVECNDIRRPALQTKDTGAINCWMDAPGRDAPRQGHVIRCNLIVDSRGKGIYLDDYASNCIVHGNVILRAATIGINVHGGKNNIIENNLFIGCAFAVGYTDYVSTRTPRMAGFQSGNRFCRNIVADLKQKVHYTYPWNDKAVAQSDWNLYFNSADAQPYLENRRQAGFETHSLIADPLFVDAKNDDYRLKPDSPALKLGFQPIDFARMGPRSDKQK